MQRIRMHLAACDDDHGAPRAREVIENVTDCLEPELEILLSAADAIGTTPRAQRLEVTPGVVTGLWTDRKS